MKTRPLAPFHPQGFALVVTVSLMVLLAVMCVGLLGLSAVSLRSSTQSQAQAEAQANARLALMIAIGELQKQLGPDQRVSANGAILSESQVRNPHWTGAWNSWQAGTKDPANPTPDAPSAHRTIPGTRDVPSGMNATYSNGRSDHFRSWLLSLNPSEATSIESARTLALDGDIMPGESANAVRLVGEGSVGTEQEGADARDYVSARLLPVEAAGNSAFRGRYGWWVGDESQKARLMNDSYVTDSDDSLAGRLSRQQAPGSMGTRTLPGFENITNEGQLAGLPSLMTASLIDGATEQAERNFHHATPYSYHVLADVREGGLKRDLSALLERPITLSESGNEFMLYKFGSDVEQQVPIQDLAAYYQLYDSTRTGWREGVKYSSSPQNNLLPSGIQISAPDYGDKNDRSQFLREYTNLYRSPVPIKLQLLLAARAEEVPQQGGANPNTPKKYRLKLGLLPAVTLWNPNNVPLVMNLGDPAVVSQQMRLMHVPFMIRWNKNGGAYRSEPLSIAYAAMGGDSKTGQPGWRVGGNNIKATIFDMYFSANRPVRLEPGETRVFSYPYRAGNFTFKKDQNDRFQPEQEAQDQDWDNEAFLQMVNSAWTPNDATDPHVDDNHLIIAPNDSLNFSLSTEKEENKDYVQFQEVAGAGFNFIMIKKLFQSRAATGGLWNFRNYHFLSRTGQGTSTRDFNHDLIRKGFPGDAVAAPLPVSQMIGNPNEWFAFMQFAIMADCEMSEEIAGPFVGRKFASRPFLHSSPMSSPYIDSVDANSLYNYGWSWWVESLNSADEALVGVSADNSGYYGGGYFDGYGTTHVIQQEIPVTPVFSIASLSHARLGGFSLANNEPSPMDPKVTAVGNLGLFPHTMQAIGNSYAHPMIPADRAFTDLQRTFNASVRPQSRTLADHSYLANKALWDEFFFSSITPQPSSVRAFGGRNRTAKQVAEDFFFSDRPLPNRRIQPYSRDFNQSRLNELFSDAADFRDGLADKIAAHLMVEGPFNVNSTSVSAWKALLSSLKGKPVAYLDKDQALSGVTNPSSASTDGTPVGPGLLANGQPYSKESVDLSDPANPEQWYSWRELNDTEIEELAEAIVKQVKRRGPFLSLSEFVNRRLDSGDAELSVKGALQAALDDPDVSINEGFRNVLRQFGSEADDMSPEFPEALEGPVAYGSAAYVDQADILRNFASQLTPRGDTFVVRTYGDALDNSGNVMARAWCEAVVQRVPEYFDPADEAHLGQASLSSSANKLFGRKLEIVSFRWLNADEI
ncbi:MAG TPA: hypothetical protein VLO11_13835 [Luteolibacter sp.]|nr:hypothetical protein [Luteolibacter sp.]